ncbi:MAG TPA: prepilin-type N-terminal cleavage/methylation domain-containing protein, partial [bacterium]|nr:prepilin-type N-terminal cleavage/methylation domain-containing protein [bacterium]
MKSKEAFTLIEILVIIVIIGILSTLATISLKVVVGKARDSRRMSDVASIRKALEIYKLNNEVYPPENQFIVGAALKNGEDLVIGKIPANPKAVDGPCAINEYLYRQDNNGLSYHLNWCLGTQVQDAGPGPCIATPNHYCAACTGGTCTGKCGGENGCGQPCPTAACPSTTPNCDEASN